MKRAALLALSLAACSEPTPHAKLPGAVLAPALARPQPNICGIDVDWNADTRVDLRYRFVLDEFGRISQGRGIYTTPRADATIEYEWDNLDHFVRYVETAGSFRYESSGLYSSLGDLLEYTTVQQGHVQRTTYSELTDTGLPTREVVDDAGTLYTYAFEYDAWSRIVRAAPSEGPPTIYSYDDDARTTYITSGEYRGVVIYDEQNQMLSETWTGEGASREDLYTYDGERLLTATHREAGVTQVSAYQYDCD